MACSHTRRSTSRSAAHSTDSAGPAMQHQPLSFHNADAMFTSVADTKTRTRAERKGERDHRPCPFPKYEYEKRRTPAAKEAIAKALSAQMPVLSVAPTDV